MNVINPVVPKEESQSVLIQESQRPPLEGRLITVLQQALATMDGSQKGAHEAKILSIDPDTLFWSAGCAIVDALRTGQQWYPLLPNGQKPFSLLKIDLDEFQQFNKLNESQKRMVVQCVQKGPYAISDEIQRDPSCVMMIDAIRPYVFRWISDPKFKRFAAYATLALQSNLSQSLPSPSKDAHSSCDYYNFYRYRFKKLVSY